MVVSGELRRGDSPSDWTVLRRLVGRRLTFATALWGAGFLISAYVPMAWAVAAGWPETQQVPLVLAGAITAIGVYFSITSLSAWRVRTAAKAVLARTNASATQRVSYSLGETFHLEGNGTVSDVAWPFVLEVFPHGNGWAVLIGTRGYPAPARFFDGAEAQRQFVRTLLQSMTSEARERSSEAREFVMWS